MSAKKTKTPTTLFERYNATQALGPYMVVPFEVWSCLHDDGMRTVSIMGDQVCLGGDYVSLSEARSAVQWYVTQLGGKVTWS